MLALPPLAPCDIVLIMRYPYSRQYSNDRHYDHQLYKGEAEINTFHPAFLNPNRSVVKFVAYMWPIED